MNLDGNLLLEKIPPEIFYKLASQLDSDEKIRKILDIYEETIPHRHYSGKDLLMFLIGKLCTVQDIAEIFRFCKLYEVLSIIYTEKLSVVRQPNENITNNIVFIKRGTVFLLDFEVWGIPVPKYTWYRNEIKLPDQNLSKLQYNSYTPQLEGNYYSIATQTFANGAIESLKSVTIEVKTAPERCLILKKPPLEQCFRVGEQILLKIDADGFPEPQYEWTHENKLLKKFTSHKLNISKCTKKLQGVYRCRVYNTVNEIIVQTMIKIVDFELFSSVCQEPVMEKIALLIGNENYQNQAKLKTPIHDIESLAPILKSKGFLVTTATDLNLNGMKRILQYVCDMIVPNSYVIFYFAGHGYEMGEKYLLPVDCPDPANFGFKDSLAEYQILRDILHKQPQLFLIFLDMCLKLPDKQENLQIYEEKPEKFEYISRRNLVQGYSTTSGLNAYEVENTKNSLYNLALTKCLSENLPTITTLFKVNQDLETLSKKKPIPLQMPFISFNVTQEFDLNAPKIGHSHSKHLYDTLNRLVQ